MKPRQEFGRSLGWSESQPQGSESRIGGGSQGSFGNTTGCSGQCAVRTGSNDARG